MARSSPLWWAQDSRDESKLGATHHFVTARWSSWWSGQRGEEGATLTLLQPFQRRPNIVGAIVRGRVGCMWRVCDIVVPGLAVLWTIIARDVAELSVFGKPLNAAAQLSGTRLRQIHATYLSDTWACAAYTYSAKTKSCCQSPLNPLYFLSSSTASLSLFTRIVGLSPLPLLQHSSCPRNSCPVTPRNPRHPPPYTNTVTRSTL